jgi:hypothetical protein
MTFPILIVCIIILILFNNINGKLELNYNNNNNLINPTVKNTSDICKLLRWIHIPKTSSSFCLSIQHACCKDAWEAIANNITDTYQYDFNNKHANITYHYIETLRTKRHIIVQNACTRFNIHKSGEKSSCTKGLYLSMYLCI